MKPVGGYYLVSFNTSWSRIKKDFNISPSLQQSGQRLEKKEFNKWDRASKKQGKQSNITMLFGREGKDGLSQRGIATL